MSARKAPAAPACSDRTTANRFALEDFARRVQAVFEPLADAPARKAA